MRALPATFLASTALIACGSESPPSGEADSPATLPSATVLSEGLPPNRPPFVRSARIVPDPALLNGPILVRLDGEDPDGDPVGFRVQWLANGRAILGATESILTALKNINRGDQLTVEVTPLDGKVAGELHRTAPVLVGNSPPEVTRVSVESERIVAGDRIRALAMGLDADQDPIQYTFVWWRNNALLPGGEGGFLETKGFARGDMIVAQATPHDAFAAGKPLFSEPVTIANGPPTITSVPSTAVNQGRYGYTVTAVDPDGDVLTYRLDTAPRGMTINPATGLITWQITTETSGTHRVRVVVEDGQGGHSYQEFDLSLPDRVDGPPSRPG